MAQALLRLVLLVLFLASVGCETLDEPPPPPPPDRKSIHPIDHGEPQPGVSATWQILPRNPSPRVGLLGLFLPEAGRPAGGAAPAQRDAPAQGDAPTQAAPGAAGSGGADALASTGSTPSPRRRRRVESVLSLDVDYRATVGGRDEERMPGRDYVRWDGIQIRPPTDLRYGFDQHLGSVDVRAGGRFFDRFSIEALTGLTLSTFHLTVRGTGIRSGETNFGIGPNVGVRLSVSPHAILNLYAQGQVHALSVLEQDHDVALVTTAELGGQLHLTPLVSVFGGYRFTSWDTDVHRSSDVRMDLSGPTFGCLLRL